MALITNLIAFVREVRRNWTHVYCQTGSQVLTSLSVEVKNGFKMAYTLSFQNSLIMSCRAVFNCVMRRLNYPCYKLS
jgi:hypothetical protein